MTAGYRADNLRAWKQTAAGRTYYYYDGGVPVLETDATGTVTAQNVFAPDGLVARYQGGWIYYTFDQQGNVTQRLDASGTVLSASTFDSYGMESTSGSPSDPFGYNGQWGYIEDRETGLYYCQNRYFDPNTGRWVNRDPIGFEGGVNVYEYTGGSPNGAMDDDGLKRIVVIIGAGFVKKGEPRINPAWLEAARRALRHHMVAGDEVEYVFGNIRRAMKGIADADEVIIVAHGWSEPHVNVDVNMPHRGGWITPQSISQARGGRKLMRIDLYACETMRDPSGRDAWKAIADHGSGYVKLATPGLAELGDRSEDPSFRW